MAPTASVRPRPLPAARLVASAVSTVALALLAACGGGGDAGPPPQPAALSAADVGVALAGPAGGDVTVPVRVRVTATGGGAVRGTTVVWTANDGGRATPASSTTDADGVAQTTWTLGTGAGVQTLLAAAGAAPVRTQFLATAAPGRPASVRLQGDTALGLVPGLAVQLRAMVADRFGNTLDAAPVAWTSQDGSVATVDAAGRLIARAPGTTTVEAVSDTARARLTVRVAPQTSLVISRVAPDTLVPGGEVVIEGAGFTSAGGGTEILVSGVRATALEVTPTRIRATVPALTALPCRATAAGVITVRRDLGTGAVDSASRAVALPVAARRTLRVGENLALLTADAARCTQLEGGSRYLVTVFNTEQSGDRFAIGQLRGLPATATAAADAPPLATRLPAPRAVRALAEAERLQAARESAQEAEHGARLQWERDLVRRAGSPLPALRAARARGEVGGPRLLGRARRPSTSLAPAPSASSGALPVAVAAVAVGDTVGINVFNLSSRSCARAIGVRARVVYTGTRAVVYEDVANQLAGTMDAELRRVGEEFDATMFPILERNFGNPLALDAQLDRDGKIGMIFSRVLNDSMPNVLGYVTSCNFFPKRNTGFAASNEMELFYARAPSPGESAASWRYNLRSTTIHELKHVTAYGEKIARAAGGIPNYEDDWLEEGSARLAEELFARTFSQAAWRGNVGYTSTVGCELTICDERPYSMAKHWTRLHLFYRNTEGLSPLVGSNDVNATFYASAWSLIRWALDHYGGQDEAAFLKALVLEPSLYGVANLAARTGRPPAEMLAEWGQAMYVDDAPGITPLRAQLTFPSWNGRDVLRGLSTFNSASYPGTFPLAVRSASFGEFLSQDFALRGWSTAYFELTGTMRAPQLLELRAPGGGPASPTLRLAIVRLE